MKLTVQFPNLTPPDPWRMLCYARNQGWKLESALFDKEGVFAVVLAYPEKDREPDEFPTITVVTRRDMADYDMRAAEAIMEMTECGEDHGNAYEIYAHIMKLMPIERAGITS